MVGGCAVLRFARCILRFAAALATAEYFGRRG